MNNRFEEFKEECLDSGEAKRLDKVEQKEEAERFQNQSEYHRQAAEDLLKGEASMIALVEGYYSMLHKANQALAEAGFKTDSHKCTLLGIRAVFEDSELSKQLQKAMDERINVDYYIDPDTDQEEFTEPKEFIENVDNFLKKLDELRNEI